jgi:hypothetical protein
MSGKGGGIPGRILKGYLGNIDFKALSSMNACQGKKWKRCERKL